MNSATAVLERLKADALEADALHAHSRRVLVSAVRAGAAAGLRQREIAEAIGRSQPEVSRLLRFHGNTALAKRLSARRTDVQRIASAHGITNVRVFGSVARGTDTDQSDIDLLVDVAPGTGLFTLGRIEQELARLLGAPIDLVPASGLRGHLVNIVLAEAVPL